MPFEYADIEQYNNEVANWAKDTDSALKSNIDGLGIKRYPYSQNPVPLRNVIKARLAKKFDLVNRVVYRMPRSAVFVHKGVSRGHPISNPRKPKEWYNPVVENRVDALGNIAANASGNLIVNGLNIK
jgi:hypothetical protein